MDLSIQKMQPPASVQGKSAAKKSSRAGAITEDNAVESADRDEKVEFRHGNTAYEQSDHEELSEKDLTNQRKRPRQKQSQLLSGEDLPQLTKSMETSSLPEKSADGLMNLRAYQSPPALAEQEEEPHFDKNI
jgi:hypothetical protein